MLYRTADALDATGSAREIADSLYADLYGISDARADRRSLFRYFHGRSSLATWLRAVIAQRHVDAVRSQRRLEPLPDDERVLPAAAGSEADPERPILVQLMMQALQVAIGELSAKDRLRLRSYYVVQMTLAAIGRMTGEHEATVSRHLSRIRRHLRERIDRHLRQEAGLTEDQIARAMQLAADDPGGLDLRQVLDVGQPRKDLGANRSQ